MKYDSAIHHRRSIRLRHYDYRQTGAYFITLCVHERRCLLGQIREEVPLLSEIGRIAETQWFNLPQRFPNIQLDAFIVMPNHIHGVLVITPPPESTSSAQIAHPVGAPLAGAHPPTPEHPTVSAPPPAIGRPQGSPLHAVVGAYKSLVFRDALLAAKRTGLTLGRLWQRNYWEHVVRNEEQLQAIREYIDNNPRQWAQDRLFAPDSEAGIDSTSIAANVAGVLEA